MRLRALTTLLALLLLLTGAGPAGPCLLCASAAHAAVTTSTMPACTLPATPSLQSDCCQHHDCAKAVQPQTVSAVTLAPESPAVIFAVLTTPLATAGSQRSARNIRTEPRPPPGARTARPNVLRV